MTARSKAGDPPGVPSGYEGVATPEDTRVPPCGVEDVDRALFTTLRDDVAFQVAIDPGKQQKVPIVFAVGEKWSMLKSGRALRDKEGTLILPLVTVRRVSLEQGKDDVTGRGMNQHVGQYVVRAKLDPRDRAYQNLLNKLGVPNSEDAPGDRDFDPIGSLATRRVGTQGHRFDLDVADGGLLASKLGVNAWQVVTLPTPQFFTATYELTIWAQYTEHMNQMLEELMASYLPTGNRTLKLETSKGYWFVAYFEEAGSADDNSDDSSGVELIRKHKMTVKVPGYLVETSAPGSPKGLRKYVSAPQIAFATVAEGADSLLVQGAPGAADPYDAADDPQRQFLLTDPSQAPSSRVGRANERVVAEQVVNPFTGRREPRFARVVQRNMATGEAVLAPDDGIGFRVVSSGEGVGPSFSTVLPTPSLAEFLTTEGGETITTEAGEELVVEG